MTGDRRAYLVVRRMGHGPDGQDGVWWAAEAKCPAGRRIAYVVHHRDRTQAKQILMDAIMDVATADVPDQPRAEHWVRQALSYGLRHPHQEGT